MSLISALISSVRSFHLSESDLKYIVNIIGLFFIGRLVDQFEAGTPALDFSMGQKIVFFGIKKLKYLKEIARSATR